MAKEKLLRLDKTGKALDLYDRMDERFKTLELKDQKHAEHELELLEALERNVGLAFGLETSDRNNPTDCAKIVKPGNKEPSPGCKLAFVRQAVNDWNIQKEKIFKRGAVINQMDLAVKDDMAERLVAECYVNIQEEIGFIKTQAGNTVEEAVEAIKEGLISNDVSDISQECCLITLQLSLLDKVSVPSDVRDPAFEKEANEWGFVVEKAEDA